MSRPPIERLSGRQRQHLVASFGADPALASPQPIDRYTRARHLAAWEKLVARLHRLGGITSGTVGQWKETWTDVQWITAAITGGIAERWGLRSPTDERILLAPKLRPDSLSEYYGPTSDELTIPQPTLYGDSMEDIINKVQALRKLRTATPQETPTVTLDSLLRSLGAIISDLEKFVSPHTAPSTTSSVPPPPPVHTPVKSVLPLVRSLRTPPQSVEPPAQPVATPAQPVATQAQSSETPAQSTETPAQPNAPAAMQIIIPPPQPGLPPAQSTPPAVVQVIVPSSQHGASAVVQHLVPPSVQPIIPPAVQPVVPPVVQLIVPPLFIFLHPLQPIVYPEWTLFLEAGRPARVVQLIVPAGQSIVPLMVQVILHPVQPVIPPEVRLIVPPVQSVIPAVQQNVPRFSVPPLQPFKPVLVELVTPPGERVVPLVVELYESPEQPAPADPLRVIPGPRSGTADPQPPNAAGPSSAPGSGQSEAEDQRGGARPSGLSGTSKATTKSDPKKEGPPAASSTPADVSSSVPVSRRGGGEGQRPSGTGKTTTKSDTKEKSSAPSTKSADKSSSVATEGRGREGQSGGAEPSGPAAASKATTKPDPKKKNKESPPASPSSPGTASSEPMSQGAGGQDLSGGGLPVATAQRPTMSPTRTGPLVQPSGLNVPPGTDQSAATFNPLTSFSFGNLPSFGPPSNVQSGAGMQVPNFPPPTGLAQRGAPPGTGQSAFTFNPPTSFSFGNMPSFGPPSNDQSGGAQPSGPAAAREAPGVASSAPLSQIGGGEDQSGGAEPSGLAAANKETTKSDTNKEESSPGYFTSAGASSSAPVSQTGGGEDPKGAVKSSGPSGTSNEVKPAASKATPTKTDKKLEESPQASSTSAGTPSSVPARQGYEGEDQSGGAQASGPAAASKGTTKSDAKKKESAPTSSTSASASLSAPVSQKGEGDDPSWAVQSSGPSETGKLTMKLVKKTKKKESSAPSTESLDTSSSAPVSRGDGREDQSAGAEASGPAAASKERRESDTKKEESSASSTSAGGSLSAPVSQRGEGDDPSGAVKSSGPSGTSKATTKTVKKTTTTTKKKKKESSAPSTKSLDTSSSAPVSRGDGGEGQSGGAEPAGPAAASQETRKSDTKKEKSSASSTSPSAPASQRGGEEHPSGEAESSGSPAKGKKTTTTTTPTPTPITTTTTDKTTKSQKTTKTDKDKKKESSAPSAKSPQKSSSVPTPEERREDQSGGAQQPSGPAAAASKETKKSDKKMLKTTPASTSSSEPMSQGAGGQDQSCSTTSTGFFMKMTFPALTGKGPVESTPISFPCGSTFPFGRQAQNGAERSTSTFQPPTGLASSNEPEAMDESDSMFPSLASASPNISSLGPHDLSGGGLPVATAQRPTMSPTRTGPLVQPSGLNVPPGTEQSAVTFNPLTSFSFGNRPSFGPPSNVQSGSGMQVPNFPPPTGLGQLGAPPGTGQSAFTFNPPTSFTSANVFQGVPQPQSGSGMSVPNFAPGQLDAPPGTGQSAFTFNPPTSFAFGNMPSFGPPSNVPSGSGMPVSNFAPGQLDVPPGTGQSASMFNPPTSSASPFISQEPEQVQCTPDHAPVDEDEYKLFDEDYGENEFYSRDDDDDGGAGWPAPTVAPQMDPVWYNVSLTSGGSNLINSPPATSTSQDTSSLRATPPKRERQDDGDADDAVKPAKKTSKPPSRPPSRNQRGPPN